MDAVASGHGPNLNHCHHIATMAYTAEETTLQLLSATEGFNYLFSNDIIKAKEALAAGDSPFHAMGLGVCSFLEAALGMEVR
jgi:hypothetical protein